MHDNSWIGRTDRKFHLLHFLNLKMNVKAENGHQKAVCLNLCKLTFLSFTAPIYWLLFPHPSPFQIEYSRPWALGSRVWAGHCSLHADYFTYSKKSVLKEINPKYSLEGLMLKLTLRHFETKINTLIQYLMQRSELLEKTLVLGKIKGKRRTGW